MNINLDSLVARMPALEHAAFVEFDQAVREPLLRWLGEFGLTQPQIEADTPRYLLELGILVVVRRAEIEPGRVLSWLRKQARNLVVPHWEKDEAIQAAETVVTARRVRLSTTKLDGSKATYDSAALALGFPSGWLRRRHRKLRHAAGSWNGQSLAKAPSSPPQMITLTA